MTEEDRATREEEAATAAETWLRLVDAGRYPESWDEAAPYLQGFVDRDRLARQLRAAREPLGALRARKLASALYATSLPGAPDGEYVVLQYETSFENKRSAVETVTPMRAADGGWKVSGYYIK
ncbi:MAG: DUF4019 domain-containing protein [Gemmatimonadota bacterium]